MKRRFVVLLLGLSLMLLSGCDENITSNPNTAVTPLGETISSLLSSREEIYQEDMFKTINIQRINTSGSAPVYIAKLVCLEDNTIYLCTYQSASLGGVSLMQMRNADGSPVIYEEVINEE